MLELAAGRGIFIWLLFRSLYRTIGWPATMGIFVALAVGTMLVRYARMRQDR